MNRGGRTRQVINFIHFNVKGERDVVPQQFKIGFIQQIDNIVLCTSEKVIRTDNILPLIHQQPA